MRKTTLQRSISALAFALLTAACGDAIGPGEEPDIDRVVLTVGSETVTVTASGPTSDLVIDGGTHAVAAAAYDSEGSRLTLAGGQELVLTSNTSRVQYAPISGLTGTLVTVAGSAVITMSIEHEGHADFGPFNIATTVN